MLPRGAECGVRAAHRHPRSPWKQRASAHVRAGSSREVLAAAAGVAPPAPASRSQTAGAHGEARGCPALLPVPPSAAPCARACSRGAVGAGLTSGRRARGPDLGAPWARPASPVWSGAPTRSPVTVRVARSRHREIRERDEPQRPMLLSTMTLPDFVFFHIFFYFFNHVSPSFYFHRQETLGAAPVPGGGAAWTPAAAGSRVAGLSPELRPGSTPRGRSVRASAAASRVHGPLGPTGLARRGLLCDGERPLPEGP